MNRLFPTLVAASALALAGSAALADPIAPGGTLSGVSIPGTTSIYNVFGHTDADGTPAFLATFGAGSGNVFTFTATGTIGCCSSLDGNYTPDGASGSTNVIGNNGLSSLSGNSQIPLVGVFTTNTDPFGGVAPAALVFNASSPTSLSPLLNQVFYIGDGRTGFNNAAGGLLSFTAPTTATRLYVGLIDAFGFTGQSGFYGDNPGSFTVNIALANQSTAPVPEPTTWAMLILGFAGVGLGLRRRRRRSAAFV
jgi:hypothetical protein